MGILENLKAKILSSLPAPPPINSTLGLTATPEKPRCRRCGRRPIECEGAYEMAVERKSGDLSAEEVDELVREGEGTYNQKTGGFWCDPCYITIGQPTGKAP